MGDSKRTGRNSFCPSVGDVDCGVQIGLAGSGGGVTGITGVSIKISSFKLVLDGDGD